ncbi:DUF1492 domain-containing protein [Streptococcus suis]|nr:DUF1492 domain-containing protein [Streptococcus suis]
MTLTERLRDARDLKPFIDSLESELIQVREQLKDAPDQLEQQESQILTAIREITAKRQRMADLIEQLPDADQRTVLTIKYIDAVKTKHLSEVSGMKDSDFYNLHQRAVKSLEKLEKHLATS